MSLTADYHTEIRVPQVQLHNVMGKALGLTMEILRLILNGHASERVGTINIPQPELRTVVGNIRELPSMKIMRQALEIVAKEKGGSVTKTMRIARPAHGLPYRFENAAIPSWCWRGHYVRRQGRIPI